MFHYYIFRGYTKINQTKCRLTRGFLLDGERWDEGKKVLISCFYDFFLI